MSDWTELTGYPRELGGNLEYRGVRAKSAAKGTAIVRGVDALALAFEVGAVEASKKLAAAEPDFVAQAIEAALASKVEGVVETTPLRSCIDTIHFVRFRGTEVDLSFSGAQSPSKGAIRVHMDLAGPLEKFANQPLPLGAPPVVLREKTTSPSRARRFEAAEAGDLAVVQEVDPRELDQCDEHGRTLLTVASANDRAPIVTWLLDAGASPKAHFREALFLRHFPEQTLEVPRGENHSLLHVAAWHHALAVVDLLLARGFEVDARDPYGGTPLLDAAMRAEGAGPVVQRLLAAGADVRVHDAVGMTPLDHAASVLETPPTLLTMLLDAGASPDGGPLLASLDAGTMSAPPLERVARANDVPALELLLARGADLERAPGALASAVAAGAEKVSAALLARKPSPAALNAALLEATDRATLERLLGAGANDLDGALASAITNIELARWLVKRGARARKSPQLSDTALHRAVGSGLDEAFELAMKAEPIIDEADGRGRTALHHAAYARHEAFVRALVERGADVNAKDAGGLTPYAYARTSRDASSDAYRAIAAFLAEHGTELAASSAGPAAPAALPQRPGIEKTEGFELGDAVHHTRFGRGEVVDVEGTGPTARVTVSVAGTERTFPASALKSVTG